MDFNWQNAGYALPSTSPYHNQNVPGGWSQQPTWSEQLIHSTVPYPFNLCPNQVCSVPAFTPFAYQAPYGSDQLVPCPSYYSFSADSNPIYYSVPPEPIVFEPRSSCYFGQPMLPPLPSLELIDSSTESPHMRPQLTSTPVTFSPSLLPSFSESPIGFVNNSAPVTEENQRGFVPIVPAHELSARTSHCSVQRQPSQYYQRTPRLLFGPDLLRPQPLLSPDGDSPLPNPFHYGNSEVESNANLEGKEQQHWPSLIRNIGQESRETQQDCCHEACWCGLNYSKYCKLCLSNNEKMAFCFTHTLYNKDGKIRCPVLRRHICNLCGATGDDAHIIKFCPVRFLQLNPAGAGAGIST